MTSTQATDTVNNLYTQAQAMRQFAVYLEGNPNDVKASLMWHKMSDHLFDAVNTYDTVVASST